MGLKLYNSLSRKKEEFEPITPGHVGMYVCGVTVYDMCHIGHARSIVLFDVIYRYLKYKDYKVTYVRNFTDVDDKIINRANEKQEDWKGLAERYIQEFYQDMDTLGVLRPDHEPKATEHIGQINSIVEDLIDKGHGYKAGEDVMFSVESFNGYGKLSGKRIDELVSGSRVKVNDKKRNPLDFVLWKGAKPGEPQWESPWGSGRPGWHIECSAMSMKYLGDSFDIHGGGADLIFPHHENEIAQSEGATGKPFVKYWVHNGFVNINSEKMSKSLGNVLNIREILKTAHPENLRIFLLSSHYRSPLDYNDTSIGEALAGLERLYSALANLDKLIGSQGRAQELPEDLAKLREKFTLAMDDDFNTPRALAGLFEAAREINRLSSGIDSGDERIPNRELLERFREEFMEFASGILGILNENPEEFFHKQRKAASSGLDMNEEEIEGLIRERTEARKARNFSRADEIRDDLAERGVILEDGPHGTTWKIKSKD
jgi:cysteinyl-tRNA synthetase